MVRQKDKHVQGYIFKAEGDPRNGNIVQIVGRCEAEGSLLEQGPCFEVQFGDGSKEVASCHELAPWFPT